MPARGSAGIISDRSEVLELAGVKVEVLAEPARALLLCKHAAVDGGEVLAKALSLPTTMRPELWLRTELGQTTSAGFPLS
jgi:hypothetical protein